MSEKEFLLCFLETAEAMGKLGDNNILDKFIDEWLEYHHKTYFEVEFIKNDPETIREEHRCQCSICNPS